MTYIMNFDGTKTVALQSLEWRQNLDLTDNYIATMYENAKAGDQEALQWLRSSDSAFVAQLYVNGEMWGSVAWGRTYEKLMDTINACIGQNVIDLKKIAKNLGITVDIPSIVRMFSI